MATKEYKGGRHLDLVFRHRFVSNKDIFVEFGLWIDIGHTCVTGDTL